MFTWEGARNPSPSNELLGTDWGDSTKSSARQRVSYHCLSSVKLLTVDRARVGRGCSSRQEKIATAETGSEGECITEAFSETGTVMRLVLTRSFAILPRPVSSPFPSSQGFQLSILSKVLPEPNVTDHRVDGADSGSPGGRRPHHFGFQTTSISSRTCTSRNSDHVPRLHPSLHVSNFNFKTHPLPWPPTTVSPVGELSVPTLPTDHALEPTQYDGTEPVFPLPTTTADAGHFAPRPADANTFSSFLDADIPWTRFTVTQLYMISMDGSHGTCNNPVCWQNE